MSQLLLSMIEEKRSSFPKSKLILYHFLFFLHCHLLCMFFFHFFLNRIFCLFLCLITCLLGTLFLLQHIIWWKHITDDIRHKETNVHNVIVCEVQRSQCRSSSLSSNNGLFIMLCSFTRHFTLTNLLVDPILHKFLVRGNPEKSLFQTLGQWWRSESSTGRAMNDTPSIYTKSHLPLVPRCFPIVPTDVLSRLCSRGAWVPQATNFCLWATGQIFFFHVSLAAGHPGFHV